MAALGTILGAAAHVPFYRGGAVSVVVFEKCGDLAIENLWPVGMSTAFWHVVVLTDSWGWVCQTCWSALELILMSMR